MPKGKRIVIDLEELENSPSLTGLMSFRETPVSKGTAIASGPGPIGAKPVGMRPLATARLVPRPEAAETPPELNDVLAELRSAPQPQRSHGKTVRATRVEDGHSQTQDTLYWWLWRHGREVRGSPSRFIQAGYGQIQSALSIDRSNVQDAIGELQKKLSIRILQKSTVGSATVYEVFSCDDILAKRRTAGLLWAHRYGTRRAELRSSPDDNEQSAPIGLTPIGFSPGVGVTQTDPMGLTPTDGIGVTPIQLVKEANKEQTTTTALTPIIQALQAGTGTADDEAATRMLKQSRRDWLDVTPAEVASEVTRFCSRLSGVKNRAAVVITQVPKLFQGESGRLLLVKLRSEQGGEVAPGPTLSAEASLQGRLESLEQTCHLLAEMPSSVNEGLWRRELEQALTDPALPDELRSLIDDVLSRAGK